MGTGFGLTGQPRVRLATLPTPLHYAARLTEQLGGPRIWLKRDDLTGLALGGNKTRKLEYLVADALAQDATHLITVGGVQSNHVRQTAAAARVAGMEAVLVLNSPTPDPAPQGNLLLDQLLGATIHYIVSGSERQATMEAVAEDLRAGGARPYLIPGGGSNGVGAVGYVAAMLELNHQLWEAGIAPQAFYFPSGGGGTQAGIVLGGALYGSNYELRGVMVEDTSAEGVERVFPIIEATADRLGIPNPVRKDDIICDDTQVGEGYGIATGAGIQGIALLARTEGVFLDHVYTAKAFAGLVADVQARRYSPDDDIVFLHTGGVPALFAYPEVLREVLGDR